MKLLKYFLGICFALCFVSCENDEEIVMPQDEQANEIAEKKEVSDNYWFPAIKLTDHFSSYYLLPLLDFIRNDDLAAVGVYVTANPNYAPPSPDVLKMYLNVNNGWSVVIGDAGRNELYLLYNNATSKNVPYIDVEVPFNYIPGYEDCSIHFSQDGTYYFTGSGGGRYKLQVAFGVDKTNTPVGFKTTIVSSCFDDGYNAPLIIHRGESDYPFNGNFSNFVYPKRQ